MLSLEESSSFILELFTLENRMSQGIAVNVDATLNEPSASGLFWLFPHVYHFNRDIGVDGRHCLSSLFVELVYEDACGLMVSP